MKKAFCNAIKINYQCVGEGNDVILIHGLATNHAFWRFEVLMALAKEYRVTVFDLRGHGYSDMPDTGYTCDDMAEDLFRLFEYLKISKANIIGHSLGGVVALKFAVLHPDMAESLVIADSRIHSLQPTNFARDWPNWEKAGYKLKELGIHIPMNERESGLWLLTKIASPEWQKKRDRLKGSPLFIPFGGWNGGHKTAERWLQLLNTTFARSDLNSTSALTTDMLSKINQPVLIMYGENSPTIPSYHGLQQYLRHYYAEIIPHAGHFYPFTIPEIFVDKVLRFFEKRRR